MKIVMVYSGKGGVGKSTITAMLAKVLMQSGNKVSLIDGDVATPSIHKLFLEPVIRGNKEGELHCFSLGYNNESTMFLKNSMIKKFLKTSVRKAQTAKFNPDYILIDTPPSMTDTHNVLLSSLKISGVLLVSQPTDLSITDVKKTMGMFLSKSIPVVGLVQNMIDDNLGVEFDSEKEIGVKTIAKIPLNKDIQTLSNEVIEKYSFLAKFLEDLSDSSVESLVTKSKIKLKGEGLVNFDELPKYPDTFEHYTLPDKYKKFITPEQWDLAKYIVVNDLFGYPANTMRDPITMFSANDCNKMFEHFDGENSAMVQIVRPPHTEIPCLRGEIGEGSLFFNENMYGIPMIRYKTSQGHVSLYLHEVKPANNTDISMLEQDGGVQTPDGRLIPNLATTVMLANAFDGNDKGAILKYFKIMQQEVDYLYTAVVKLLSLADECLRDKNEDSYSQIKDFKLIVSRLKSKLGRYDTAYNESMVNNFLEKNGGSNTEFFKYAPKIIDDVGYIITKKGETNG